MSADNKREVPLRDLLQGPLSDLNPLDALEVLRELNQKLKQVGGKMDIQTGTNGDKCYI